MKKRRILAFPFLLISLVAGAQQHFDFNLFNGSGELRSIFVQRHRLNDKYTLNLDAGSYVGLGNNIWTRWGFRGNISRKINDFYSCDIGFMYNRVHYEDDIIIEDVTERMDVTRHEYRPHQAFHISYPRFQASSLKHRFRLEERIFTQVHSDIRNFKMRLRYRVMNQGRFDGKPIAPKSIFYRTFAEFNFNIYQEAEDVFWVRGRYCMGLGYMFSSKLSADANYYFEHTKVASGKDPVITHIFKVTLRQTLYWNQ
ncbi:MAG: DUF2490 domain-containing protein [Bacteroidales bacterium]|nr:DUF2490 domain-containing protein [Bacteroidales bacterium]